MDSNDLTVSVSLSYVTSTLLNLFTSKVTVEEPVRSYGSFNVKYSWDAQFEFLVGKGREGGGGKRYRINFLKP